MGYAIVNRVNGGAKLKCVPLRSGIFSHSKSAFRVNDEAGGLVELIDSYTERERWKSSIAGSDCLLPFTRFQFCFEFLDFLATLFEISTSGNGYTSYNLRDDACLKKPSYRCMNGTNNSNRNLVYAILLQMGILFIRPIFQVTPSGLRQETRKLP